MKNFHEVHDLKASPGDQQMLRVSGNNPATHQFFEEGDTTSLASARVKLIRTNPTALQLQIGNLSWLLLSDFDSVKHTAWIDTANLPQADVLWWSSSKNLTTSLVSSLKPEVVVVSSSATNPQNLAQLQAKDTQVYWTDRDGAVQWSLGSGFATTLEPNSSVDSKLN